MKSIFITGGSGFIGTNLIDYYIIKGYNFINFDKAKPLKKDQEKYWVEGNILDINCIKKAFNQFRPNIVIHLAARTDCDSNDIKDYTDNTDGTRNLVDCIKEFDCVKQVIITSTQYVYKSKQHPFQSKENDYLPYTTYGKSKVITEEITRNANLSCTWTIVRPCNVWGPWHMRYPNELWKMIDKGFYVHASNKEVIRTYAYVKNVVHQINAIINAPVEKVNKKTFYLGDLPVDSYLWLSGISQQFRNVPIKRVPSSLFIIPATLGDLLKKMGIPSPIYTTRYRNMTENYYGPTNITIREFGLSHPDLQNNIKETADWIKGEGCVFFPYWSQKKHK